MWKVRVFIVTLAAVVAAGCHPLAAFIPADLPSKDAPLVLSSTAAWPKAEVQIFTDDLGIPHLYGKSETDLSYAMGVMHGRDRSFQIFLYIHAGEGRLSELLGDAVLDFDRENRVLMYGADEQIAAFSGRDKEMVEAYVAGLNEGASMAGRTAEMALLGVDWAPVTPRDILAIVRLQQWDQGIGFRDEMARYALVKKLGRENPIVKELMIDPPSGGVPIVAAAENAAAPFTPHAALPTTPVEPLTPPPSTEPPPPEEPSASKSSSLRRVDPNVVADIRALLRQGGTGASNSWSVSGALTESGKAIVCNDPHLEHSAPGVFYMIDMHMPDGTVVAGGSFPGIPGVLIGHGANIAWGVTNAFADTEDVVVVERKGDKYVVDGVEKPFKHVKQTFKSGGETITEDWLETELGPVLPKTMTAEFGAGDDTFALLWTAQQYPADNGRLVSAFWDLAAAKNVDEATKAVQDFASPAMSVNMAFTDGTIAYRLSGIVPLRVSDERADFPRHSGWNGRVPAEQKPSSTNPTKGYIVAANQRIVENGVGSQAAVGFEAARPYRAMRIDTRLREAMKDGHKPNAEELLQIQLDITAIDAKELAPIFAAHCPKHVDDEPDERTKLFCEAVASFDGVYTAHSKALPFAMLAHDTAAEVIHATIGDDIGAGVGNTTFASMALLEAAKREHAGEKTALFDDPTTPEHEGLDYFVARATKHAMARLVADAGDDWHWGRLHKLSLRGALARAPVIGFLFQTDAREEAGTSSTPHAEAPSWSQHLRVTTGAGLRLVAEMSTPPVVRMINDSGQSGHFGARHLEDQFPLWDAAKPRVLSLDVATAAQRSEGALVIRPATKAAAAVAAR